MLMTWSKKKGRGGEMMLSATEGRDLLSCP